MSTPAPKPIPLGPFTLGVNNRLPDTELKPKSQTGAGAVTPAFIRQGVNVDVTQNGKLRRRAGVVKKLPAAAGHSLWTSPTGTFGAYADGATLYRLLPGFVTQVLRTDVSPERPVSYDYFNGMCYYSDGFMFGRFNETVSAFDWGSMPDVTDMDSPAYMFSPLPAGTIIRYNNGRLFSVAGNRLRFSKPFAYNLYDPKRNFIDFPSPIQLIVPMFEGIYIATTELTYYIDGDVVDAELVKKLPYGALPGLEYRSPNKDIAVWMTPRGVVVAEGNNVKNVQEDNVAVQTGESAACLVRESDGMRKALASVQGLNASSAAARTYMDAEIIRKGTQK